MSAVRGFSPFTSKYKILFALPPPRLKYKYQNTVGLQNTKYKIQNTLGPENTYFKIEYFENTSILLMPGILAQTSS